MKREKKKRTDWRRVLQNNCFMLRLLYRASPGYVISGIIRTVLNVADAFLTRTYLYLYAINAMQAQEKISTVLLTVGGIFAYSLFYMAFSHAWSWYASLQAPKIERNIMRMLQDKSVAVELACFERPSFYDTYVKAMGETVDRVYNVYWNMMDFVWVILNIAAVGTLMITIDPIFLALAMLPFLYTALFGKRRNRIQHQKDMDLKELGRRRSYVQRTFYLSDYAKEMRLTDMWQVTLRQMRTTVAAMKEAINKYGYSLMMLNFASTFLFQIVVFVGGVVLAVFKTLVRGNMLLGDCFVVINSISNLSYNIEYAAEVVIKLDEHSRYINNLRTFLDYEIKIPENKEAPAVPQMEELTLSNVGFRYEDGDKQVLDRVNMTLRRGERIALVGHNGAGKTTLIKLLMRLYDPSEGEILLNGKPIDTYRLSTYRALFGCVFQDYQLFATTVAENVLLDRCRDDMSRENVEEALQRSGISNKVHTLSSGIDTNVTREFDDNGVLFSGGESQKISIARVFACPCEIVILDEPTSALDPIAEQEMYRSMFAACEGKTVIFISHRLSSATMADRIYLFENGRIEETGTHAELLQKDGKYAEMWNKQAKSYQETNGEGETV